MAASTIRNYAKIAGRIFLSFSAILLCQLATWADVTITQRLGWNSHSPQSGWTRRMLIKGHKLKIESEHDNKVFVSLYDLDVGQESYWDSKGKVVNVFDLSIESTRLEKAMKGVRTSVQPTGQSKQTLTGPCDQFSYEIFIALPRHMVKGILLAPVEHDSGTICVSRGLPGSTEFVEFAQAAKTLGYVLGSISQDQASIDSSSVLFLMAADLNGLFLERSSKSEFQGGAGVGFYGAAASNEFNATVTAVTSGPIADEEFRVPDGRKIQKDRSMGPSVPVSYQRESTASSSAPEFVTTRN